MDLSGYTLPMGHMTMAVDDASKGSWVYLGLLNLASILLTNVTLYYHSNPLI